MKTTLAAILFILISLYSASYGQVSINEFMSDNKSGLQDYEGDYSDWIELYNAGNTEVNLLNYSLSDDKDNHRKWIFPSINIPAKGFLIVYASGKNTVHNNELHTNFKIKKSGETLILCNSSELVLSMIKATNVPTDKSYACTVDGGDIMQICDNPTPNASNIVLSTVKCSHSSGFYTNSIKFDLQSTDKNLKIYYTLNGDTPNVKSKLYTKPITITEKPLTPLNYSFIPTTPLSGSKYLKYYIWKKPKSVYQCNVIRYASFKNGIMQSDVNTKVFFVGENIKNKYTFPIISIATDSINLFDYEKGIYVPGKTFDKRKFETSWAAGNYINKGKDWERKAHVTYFEKTGKLAFDTDVGIRTHGFGSAANPQKSFKLYFRKEYGISKIEYPIFNKSDAKKYKRLIFRNSGQDFLHTHFRDAMLQQIIEPLNLDLQAFQPSIVFINGEYWGIFNIREKYDKFYFKYKFGIDEEDINILNVCGSIEEGDDKDYIELIHFIENNDISIDENYDYVASKLDIDNFIDYNIAEIYFANYDWPCNNYRMWKDNNPESKWRFLIYDLDFSFDFPGQPSKSSTKSMQHATNTLNEWPYCECSNIIFRSLLRNNKFKQLFLDRFAYCLNEVFNTERVNFFITQFEQLYSPEIEEHIDRWNYPANAKAWKSAIDRLRQFAAERPCYMSEDIMSFFKLSTYKYDCLRDRMHKEQGNELLVLFPNPNTGEFTIFNKSDNKIEAGKLKIVDYLGKTIYSQENILISPKARKHFRPNNLKNGVYVVIFTSGAISELKKIIVSESTSE